MARCSGGIKNEKDNVHHFGCDMERCPKCEGQFAFCDCKKESLEKMPVAEKIKGRRNYSIKK